MKPSPIKPIVTYETFQALDIRVGTILQVEDMPKAARLVRLTVDFGDHQRQIVAGLKQERTSPKEIEGKQTLFIVNLAPREMMGELSDGMLLDIGFADGELPCLALPERPVPNGVRAG